MEDTEESPKRIIEVEEDDSVLVLHKNNSFSVIEGEDDLTFYFLEMLVFLLTDMTLFKEVKEIYEDYLETKEKENKNEESSEEGKIWTRHDLN